MHNLKIITFRLFECHKEKKKQRHFTHQMESHALEEGKSSWYPLGVKRFMGKKSMAHPGIHPFSKKIVSLRVVDPLPLTLTGWKKQTSLHLTAPTFTLLHGRHQPPWRSRVLSASLVVLGLFVAAGAWQRPMVDCSGSTGPVFNEMEKSC